MCDLIHIGKDTDQTCFIMTQGVSNLHFRHVRSIIFAISRVKRSVYCKMTTPFQTDNQTRRQEKVEIFQVPYLLF